MVFLTILALILGILYGLSGLEFSLVNLISNNSNLILSLLMFTVGISIGFHEGIIEKIKEYHFKIFIIPLAITLASVLGGLILGIVTKYGVRESMAITSGMGWYSLAGATLTELAGASIGTIAFLSNLMREIISFILIPPISKKLNYYTCIAPAGATSEDTTLPMMFKYTNAETVVLAVFNGMITSFFVPILISLFFSF